MSDGSKLRQTWYSALNDAEAHFRRLLTSPPTEWKRLTTSADSTSSKQKGKSKGLVPDVADVLVHRNFAKGGEDVYRMVLDVPTGEEQVSLEPWKAVLTTPELRQEWDPAVEDAHLVEVFDHITRISKTNYTLGWPANPRDSITISRAFHDTTTLIDITTSLPRSADEPAYLRPSPPFVRSHVKLFAWCVQHTQPQPSDTKKSGRLRITCFWQHDLKALWGFGSSTSSLTQQLSTMMLSLLKTVMKRGGRVPKLTGYGNGVSVERIRYQIDRESLMLDYSIIPDEDEHHEVLGLQGMEEVHALREHRRLTRSVEWVLPSLEGWDVQITVKGSSDEVENIPWSALAMRSKSNSSTFSPPDQILLRVTHGALTDNDSVLKVKVIIEVSEATRGLRLNGLASKIHELEERDPTSKFIPQKILQDVASAVDLSVTSSIASTSSAGSVQPLVRPHTERTAAAEKSILSKVRRNYIYFSSLLQEPEAKWRRTTDARGVAITQLDSIDPTLVVYRAEATFVGVNLWDLYAAVVSPGARMYWDKQHEDGVLLEDVNELTELWHFKTKPAWPVNGRDSVVLKTVYKSPTTIHVFSFSADDTHLFPTIPPVEPNVIRTQVDLQGWAIESLSPTTTLLTLLEQSDPKGWTNKTSIPTQMINTLAGIGEFAIKCGGPPVVTRLAGAKANELRYDHEKGAFRVEYEPSISRRTNSTGSDDIDDSSFPTIECEIRCDIDTWGASLDIVVDPPPQTITCLRRHRLSTEGGGLWLTMTHDSIFVDDERLLALVRRAPGKEKGLVMVNGAKVAVDVDELPEAEIKALARQKRVKPPRIPLDQPPVVGVIRRRKAEWTGAGNGNNGSEGELAKANSSDPSAPISVWASAPKISSPLSRLFTYAVDQATSTTQQAVAAISPANYAGGSSSPDPTKLPMQYALEALAWTQEFNSKPRAHDGWTTVSDKGVVVERRLMPEISPFIPVHKGFKVIEGVSAEELASVIMELECRKTWDERYDSATMLESYGSQARTTFLVAKGGFPFRDRGFYLANVVARAQTAAPGFSRRNTGDVAEQSNTTRNAIFCVSASFSPESAKSFSAAKYNPYGLPIGRVYLDAWILETLDPYTKENYAIPSSRCTRLVAVDYAGSVPAAFNSTINAASARGVLAVEAYMKSLKISLPVTRLPAPCFVVSEKRPEDHNGAASSTGTGTGVDGESGMGVLVTAPFMAWKLRKRDESRVLVDTKFDVEKKVHRSTVVIKLQPKGGTGSAISSKAKWDSPTPKIALSGDTDNTKTASNSSITPRPSRLGLSPSPQRRQREPSGGSLPGVPEAPNTAKSDSALQAAPTPTLPMPGSMIYTPGLPASSTMSFPGNTSSNISGLPSISSSNPLFPPSPSSPSSGLPGSTSTPPRPPSRHNTSSVLQTSSPLRIRQRAISSGSGALHAPHGIEARRHDSVSPSRHGLHGHAHNTSQSLNAAQIAQLMRDAGSQSVPSTVRGRTMSSAFNTKGEVKPQVDFVVMEVVVDSKMYSKTGYVVEVKARRRRKVIASGDVAAPRGVPLEASISTGSASSTQSGSTASTSSTSADSTSSSTIQLPFVYTIHTVPSSPLHSSGLSAEPPSRHLVKLTLPTAQYRANPVWDPLVGAMRSPPEKPDWMKVLEGEEPDAPADESINERDGGIVVDLVVRPKTSGDVPLEDSAAAGDTPGKKSTDKAPHSSSHSNPTSKQSILVNGKLISVVGEKESLTSLGREELLDERVGRMGVLSRIPNESEPLPDELKIPIGIAKELSLPPEIPSVLGSTNAAGGTSGASTTLGGLLLNATASGQNTEGGADSSKIGGAAGRGEDSPSELGGAGQGGGPGGPHASHAATQSGFLGFLQGYPAITNPWARLSSSVNGLSGGALLSGTLVASDRDRLDKDKHLEGASGIAGTILGTASGAVGDYPASGSEVGVSGAGSGGETRAELGRERQHAYPLSTLVFVALIAFLIGSLLRSLLSPADFIYVVTDLSDAEEAGAGTRGWREIRRLLEIKYLVGGWDFQVAVVRRH